MLPRITVFFATQVLAMILNNGEAREQMNHGKCFASRRARAARANKINAKEKTMDGN